MTSSPILTELTQKIFETVQQQTVDACLRQIQTPEFLSTLGIEQQTQEIVAAVIERTPKSDFEQEMRAQTETTEQIMNFLQEVLQDHQSQMDEAQGQIVNLIEQVDGLQRQVKRLEKENLAFRAENSNNRTFILDRLNALQEQLDRS